MCDNSSAAIQAIGEINYVMNTAAHWNGNVRVYAQAEQLMEYRSLVARRYGETYNEDERNALLDVYNYTNQKICHLLGIPFKNLEK